MNLLSSFGQSLKSKLRSVNFAAIEYCINDEHFHTIVQIPLVSILGGHQSHFSEVTHFEIQITFRNQSGKVLKHVTLERSAKDAFVYFDSHDLIGKEIEFQGSIEYQLVPKRKDGSALPPSIKPIEPSAFLVWTDDQNTLTSTHANHITTKITKVVQPLLSAHAFIKNARNQSNRVYPGAVALWCSDELKSSFLFQNGRFFMRSVKFEIRNTKGESRFAEIQNLAPFELREVFAEEFIKDLAAFADADFVELVLHDFPLDIANKRLLIKTYHQASGSFSIDHSFQISSGRIDYPQPELTPEEQRALGKGPFFPHTIELSKERKTILVIYNCEYQNTPKEFGLTVFRSDGTKVFEQKRFSTIPARGFSVIHFADIIKDQNFTGHFEVYFTDRPNTDHGTVSSLLHGQVFYTHPNGLEANQVGSAVWNLKRNPLPPNRVAVEKVKKYVTPFWVSETFNSRVHISNVGCFDEDIDPVHFKVTLLQENGKPISEIDIGINPLQSVLIDASYFKGLKGETRGLASFEPKSREHGAVPMHYDIASLKSLSLASDHAIGC
jgi:hypothetical protein